MSLVEILIKQGSLKTPALIKAFQQVSRADFVVAGQASLADLDQPLPIGFGQTISQPTTVALMLELLVPQPGERILDAGSGSGWTTALLAAVVGDKGQIYGLERLPELVSFGQKNIEKYPQLVKRIQFLLGDAYQGLPAAAPFDRILVSAAASSLPEILLKELTIGGRLVMPIGPPYQSQVLTVVDRLDQDRYQERTFPGFIFVPLVKN